MVGGHGDDSLWCAAARAKLAVCPVLLPTRGRPAPRRRTVRRPRLIPLCRVPALCRVLRLQCMSALVELGLVWECNGPETHPLDFATVLGGVFATASRHPRLAVCLNHCGGAVGPTAFGRSGAREEWEGWMGKLATLPNVVVKVGGCQMPTNGFPITREHMPEQPVGSQALAQMTLPVYGFVIDTFGAERCMFESNFPVDKQCVGYGVLWNSLKRIVSTLGLDEHAQQQLFHGTAARVYGLALPPPS